MTLILNGTDNSATVPAVQGGTAGTTTGVYYPTTNQVAIATNGTQAVLVDASQNVTMAGTATAAKFIPTGNSATGNGMYLPATNAVGISTNGINAVYIDASQNVGIGTSTPAAKVDVAGAASSIGFKVRGGGNSGINILDVADAGGSGRTIIDASGNLLVGTIANNTASRFRVSGSSQGIDISVGNSGTNYITNTSGTASYNAFDFANNGQKYSTCGTITVSGSNTSYNTASDYRLKENIAPMTGALTKVAQLKPVTYKWKVDGSDGQGFVAHELQDVAPDCVTGIKDAIDADGKPVYQGIDTSFLIATLTAAIQEQQALIMQLTDRIAALEAK
jgi:hypothetical protein